MTDRFFDRPILRSPCARRSRYWNFDESRRHYTLMDVINDHWLQQPGYGQR